MKAPYYVQGDGRFLASVPPGAIRKFTEGVDGLVRIEFHGFRADVLVDEVPNVEYLEEYETEVGYVFEEDEVGEILERIEDGDFEGAARLFAELVELADADVEEEDETLDPEEKADPDEPQGLEPDTVEELLE